MRNHKTQGVIAIAVLSLLSVLAGAHQALAQELKPASADAQQRSEINHEVLLYLLAASGATGESGGRPQPLEPVVKQLRAALPFNNFRLAATFLHRVKDGGNLEVNGVGGSPLVTPPTRSGNPTFLQFSVSNVRSVADAAGQPFVQINRLRFGLKVPIVTATVRGEGGAENPVTQYQDTGISTELSVREGVPTVVGTLPAGRPDESFVLVISVRRAAPR